jgi:nucleoside-diphosphate-sugar epimerase
MDKLIIGFGYLGRRIAPLWQALGHRVFVTTRSPERAGALRAGGLEPIVCDVLAPDRLSALPSVATVVYCVGFDRTAGATMRDVYVRGLGNVLDQLPRPGRFLYVSSTGVYGQSGGEDVDEHAPTIPAEESGRVILEAERLLRARLPEAVVLRFAGIYGPDRLLRRQALLAGEPFVGDPDRWLNLIHVEDGAAAVLAAEERGRPGEVYNICDDAPVPRRAFYALLARLLGAPQPSFVEPEPGARLPAHERTNRRIVNQRMRQVLQADLRYPSYEEGLRAAGAILKRERPDQPREGDTEVPSL